jgi:hypothetical protein
VATVQLPLPLLDVRADTRTAFFGLCLDAGQHSRRQRIEGPAVLAGRDADRRLKRAGV